MQLGENGMEMEIVAGLAQLAVQFPKPVQDPAFQFRHVRDIQAFVFGETVEVAEQVTERVAQPAINIGLAF